MENGKKNQWVSVETWLKLRKILLATWERTINKCNICLVIVGKFSNRVAYFQWKIIPSACYSSCWLYPHAIHTSLYNRLGDQPACITAAVLPSRFKTKTCQLQNLPDSYCSFSKFLAANMRSWEAASDCTFLCSENREKSDDAMIRSLF